MLPEAPAELLLADNSHSTDTLTGLLNRRSFSERFAAVQTQMHPVAVAMVDLDHFKTLNDTYGHETCDRTLRLFSRVLRDSLRTSDVVSRYGGEEFAIAFADCSAVHATQAVNTVRTQLAAALMVGGYRSSPCASASLRPTGARNSRPCSAGPMTR